MKYPDVENINVVVSVKVNMTWSDAMKLRLAGLTNALREEEIK